MLSVKQQIRERFLKRFNKRDKSPLDLTVRELREEMLIPQITNFIAAFSTFSRKLFDTHGQVPGLGSRLGRAEVLVYFIYDDVKLGGSSTSHDVIVDGRPRVEIKCAKKEGDRYHHFMMGIEEVPASFKMSYRLLKLFEKNDRAGKLMLPQNFANISKSKIEALKKVSPVAYRHIEKKYFDDLMSSGAGKKHYLFFDQITSLPIACGLLTPEQLKIERVSGGLTRLSFKP